MPVTERASCSSRMQRLQPAQQGRMTCSSKASDVLAKGVEAICRLCRSPPAPTADAAPKPRVLSGRTVDGW